MTADLVVYHGTAAVFRRFRVPAGGLHFGTFDQAAHVATMQLGRLALEAFDALPAGPGGWKGRIVAARLCLTRAKRVGDARTALAWAGEIRRAKRDGYDGLVYRNEFEGRVPADSFVVFCASQVLVLAWSASGVVRA